MEVLDKPKIVSKGRSSRNFSMFNSKEANQFISNEGIRNILSQTTGATSTEERDDVKIPTETIQKQVSNDGKSCTLCGVKFTKLEDQRAHFKLDWHKYNIKQMLLQRDTVKEDVFEEIISGDVSSISGSDSESDSAEEPESADNAESNPLMTLSLIQTNKNKNEDFMVDKSNPKIYFVNNSGTYMSVYREVVLAAKAKLKTSKEVESKIKDLPKEHIWLILMTGGGHFAGAIFSGDTLVVRKTFHRYTVRAKRGTAQGIRDSKHGGHQPKSAGASLRRYNEAALAEEIQNLLESWSKHIETCDKIFIRVPSNYKWIFFAGKKPPFKKDDSRIRTIPFPTRRATFKEVEKVHQKLSTVEIHENYLADLVMKSSGSKHSTVEKGSTKSEKSLESFLNDSYCVVEEEFNMEQVKETENCESGAKDDINSNGSGKIMKGEQNLMLSKKDKTPTKSTKNKEKQVVPEIWLELYDAVKSGNVEKVKCIAAETKRNSLTQEMDNNGQNEKDLMVEGSSSNGGQLESLEMKENRKELTAVAVEEDGLVQCKNVDGILNQTFDDYGETVLHLASRLAQTDILKTLLEAGADPTIKDSKRRVPFIVAKDKATRCEFRRFMASFPEKFDYKKAQIPSPLTSEMEEEKNRKIAEKKKAQTKARKQRLKEKKADEKQKEDERIKREKEEQERNWFQKLSDREKRAVAAERRLGVICFNCSKSLQGLVPFERLSNKYCSTGCVHKHRQVLETTVTNVKK